MLIAWTDGDLWCGYSADRGERCRSVQFSVPWRTKQSYFVPTLARSVVFPLLSQPMKLENSWYLSWTASKPKQILKYTSLQKVKPLLLSCTGSISSDKVYHFNWFLSVFIVGLSVETDRSSRNFIQPNCILKENLKSWDILKPSKACGET